MASDNESNGSDPSRRPSAVSTAGSFDDDEWESIGNDPFSGDFPAKKSNTNFRSELGIFVNIERDSSDPPSADQRGGRATSATGPRRPSGTSTTGSFAGDDWERIEYDHLTEDGNASRRGSSSNISRGWTFEDGDGGAHEGDGYLADEAYYEVEDAENTPRASDYQNRGNDPSVTSPASAFPPRPKLDTARGLGVSSATFSSEPRTSRWDWKDYHRTSTRGSSPRRNEILLRSHPSFRSIPQAEAPSAQKKRIFPQIEIEVPESDDNHPTFADRRPRTLVRNPSHRTREEYSPSAPWRHSASPRYSNVRVADSVAPSESPRRDIASSNADKITRFFASLDSSLQQDSLERRALSEVRDIEEAPHSILGSRNSVLREDDNDSENGSHLFHPRDSSNTMSQRLAPWYLPPNRREPGGVVVGRNPSERSHHENTFRFPTPSTNGDCDEVGTMERQAGPVRSNACHRRGPTLTLIFQAPPPHSNQTSTLETAAPQSISSRPQYEPYWPLGNSAHHVNRLSNSASRASALNPAPENTDQLRSTDGTGSTIASSPSRGNGSRRSAHNGASTHDPLQHARNAEASQVGVQWDKASSDQLQFQR